LEPYGRYNEIVGWRFIALMFVLGCGDDSVGQLDGPVRDGSVRDAPIDGAVDAPVDAEMLDGAPADASLDGPNYCIAPDGGRAGEAQACSVNSAECVGEPCAESRCFSLQTLCVPTNVADGTPCDDHDPNSFAYPCNPGECPAARCTGGPNANAACVTNSDCCAGGDCAGTAGSCSGGFCASGSETGHVCTRDSDCPKAGRCLIWSCDDVHHYCTAGTSNSFCNTQADCPTTSYCAYGFLPCGSDGHCRDFQNNDNGVCFQWTCNTATHRCESPLSCGGGYWGFGGSCKNVCRSGLCDSNFVFCQ
jgi:hypothetical protein